TSPEVQDMRARLMKPAGVLTYSGRGFGDLTVNFGGIRDVDWGPRPLEISLKAIGAGRAVQATWTVTFCIPVCDDAVYEGIREFTYTVRYSIDRAGYTTRYYDAELKIAQTRTNPNAKAPATSADEFREDATPPTIRGFRRASQDFQLSSDRNTLRV